MREAIGSAISVGSKSLLFPGPIAMFDAVQKWVEKMIFLPYFLSKTVTRMKQFANGLACS